MLRVPVSHRAVIAVDLNIRKYWVAWVPWSDSLYRVSCDGISLILAHWFAKGSKAKTTSFDVLFSRSFAAGENSFIFDPSSIVTPCSGEISGAQ